MRRTRLRQQGPGVARRTRIGDATYKNEMGLRCFGRFRTLQVNGAFVLGTHLEPLTIPLLEVGSDTKARSQVTYVPGGK